MKYDPNKHHRRSIRLKGYDYTSPGMYFITVCTHQRQCLFGAIVDGEMELNDFGQIAVDCWQQIPKHFPKVCLDRFIVMPDRIHSILVIIDNDMDMAMSCPYEARFGLPIAGSLPTILGSFKSATTKRINISRNSPGNPVWQRNYYENIIRDSAALLKIREYIQTNPLLWHLDSLHPNNPSKW